MTALITCIPLALLAAAAGAIWWRRGGDTLTRILGEPHDDLDGPHGGDAPGRDDLPDLPGHRPMHPERDPW